MWSQAQLLVCFIVSKLNRYLTWVCTSRWFSWSAATLYNASGALEVVWSWVKCKLVPGFVALAIWSFGLKDLNNTCIQQRWARIRAGSDWFRTEANFGRIRTGLDWNFFEIWRIRTGSDWENFSCFNVIILNISKISLFIRFYWIAKWSCISSHQWQKLCWDYFSIWTASTFVHT